MRNQGKSLSETFVPKTLIRKASLINTNPILQKNQFQKTQGNLYVEIDPPQIKYNGYELNKINTMSFNVINKAPVPQRFNIIAPTQANFSIKVNKKGSIPTGMYETVQVFFKSNEFKYNYDVVKINTETENFVVPLYAYPTIANLNNLFPKLLDFGHIDLKQTESYFYPIKNPTPIDFPFEFMYKVQCPEIMINPLNGTIPGNGEVVIEIAFIPNRKQTYSSEVYFRLKQFDYQPFFIRIIGNGKDKQIGQTIQRLKSSKLVPLKQKEENKQKQAQKQRMNQTQSFLNSKMKQQKVRPNLIIKSNIKTTFPKLLNSTFKVQPTINANVQTINENQKSNLLSIKNSEERIFMNRFNKVKDLDKQKQIKFSQFLGDPSMTEGQISDQKDITQQMKDLLHKLLKEQCEKRINPEKGEAAEAQYKKFNKDKNVLSWDENKNDQLHERRVILNRFVLAASKIIEVKRILKRLGKIKQFIGDSKTKQEVRKKIQESYQKSLDFQSGFGLIGQIEIQFNRDSLIPSYFQLQFNSGVQKASNKLFETEGKTEFDDLTEIDLIEPKQNEKFFYKEFVFPLDFVNIRRLKPLLRVSGQEEFSLKSSSLPNVEPIESYDILSKALDVPNHLFIYSAQNTVRFKSYNSVDEKDSLFVFSENKNIEDEFEGWSKGDYEILKYKLLKNAGVQYSGFSSFNNSSTRNDIGFWGDITKHLPQFIEKPQIDDRLEDDDSDDEKYEQNALQAQSQFLKKVQTSAQIKDRRQKRKIWDQDGKLRLKIQKNLNKDKINLANCYVGKAKDLNKWIQKDQNKIVC